MVKPETGYRGVGVRVVRDRDQLGTALTDARRDVAAQRYHAGPHEIGVFWVRDPATIGREAEAPAPHGRIFAVTRKTFPSIDGDGRTTLRRLIMRHPRYRKQAAVYFLEHAGRLDRVIAHGDSVVLSSTGNHMQGCIFSDGMDIVTPAFEAAIDAMLRDWQGAGGGAFDFGRFDVRYADEDELRAGRGFSIIELNGVTSEATSLYDPGKRYRWARSLLCEQWRIVYTIGARRRALGREPMSIWGVLRALVSVRNR
jgi:hypothetical protein